MISCQYTPTLQLQDRPLFDKVIIFQICVLFLESRDVEKSEPPCWSVLYFQGYECVFRYLQRLVSSIGNMEVLPLKT